MSERGLPDGYVLCDFCNKAMPQARLEAHRKTHAGYGLNILPSKTAALLDAICGVPNDEYRDAPPCGVVMRMVKINKTEKRYYDTYLKLKDARYEALTFHMVNGMRYTPDFVVFEAGLPVECIEVKSSYRFGSHNRAQLAFAQCRIEFSGLKWTWATWNSKEKKWKVEE